MRALLILSLMVGLSKGNASTGGDVVLSGYYLGKGSLPFFLLPVAIEDGDQVLLVDLGLMAVLTAPASGVLYHRWMGNPGKVALWRKINFGIDLALAGGGAIWSISTMLSPDDDPDDYSDVAGALGLMFSGIYATTCLLDLIPFSSESALISDLTVHPVYAINSKRAGLNLQYHF